ncbi:hypothetical protein ACIF6L_02135 [Kitasatospora sp. NPDC086009]|uniref:hypothetical protein n=1 Tax=unclassified Kitasatospora TaxID=2633591 RepID=UPI0037C73244
MKWLKRNQSETPEQRYVRDATELRATQSFKAWKDASNDTREAWRDAAAAANHGNSGEIADATLRYRETAAREDHLAAEYERWGYSENRRNSG